MDDLLFALRASGEFARALYLALTGGRVEATRDLGVVLPEGMRLEAEGRALVHRQRLAAEEASR